jgi:hypothetical protein
MLGEHPSRKRPSIDYEANMAGSRCVSKAGSGTRKMAAGGVAKIRHKQATPSGKPRGRRTHVDRGYM